jgi:hypothetical protein
VLRHSLSGKCQLGGQGTRVAGEAQSLSMAPDILSDALSKPDFMSSHVSSLAARISVDFAPSGVFRNFRNPGSGTWRTRGQKGDEEGGLVGTGGVFCWQADCAGSALVRFVHPPSVWSCSLNHSNALSKCPGRKSGQCSSTMKKSA